MDKQQRETAKVFDEYTDKYSSTVDDAVSFTGLSADFFTSVKADYIKDLVAQHFGRVNISALDVGCGIGNYHPLLAASFGELAGVDVSESSIETARQRNAQVAYKSYDGGVLPYDAGTFDLTFAICVLHHVPIKQWELFVGEMRRVLKPGGMALIFEHNPRNKLTMRAVNRCAFDKDAVLLRREDTEALMRGSGFSSIEGRFILSVPAAGAALRRLDRLFSGLPFGAQYYVKALK